jgi:phosphatidylglycerophosphatase A
MAISPALLREQGVAYWKQFIVSGCYTGLAPIASGTLASALAALFYFIPGCSSPIVLVVASLAAFAIGIPLAGQVEKASGDSDPSFVTIDEFAGQWLTLATPFVMPNLLWVVLCFFTFRAFDISKLWPASYFERRPGGLGVMGDDMVAGVYANLAAHLIWFGLQYVAIVREFLK